MRSLNEIVKILKDNGITGYKLAKETDITEPGANKILFGESLNPRKTTLKMLDEYITKNITNTKQVREPSAVYGKKVPFYNIDVTASNVVSFDDMPEVAEYNVDFKPFNDCKAMLPIVGDSMYPEFKNGDIVAIKDAPSTHILYGETYLVITKEGYRTIKKLRKHEDETKIILKPVNPNYDPDTILKEDILKLFLVKGQFKIHSY